MDLTANDCAELSGVSVRAINAWKYLYHAVDKEGKTIDFLLTARRNKEAAQCLFDKVMKATCISEKATMDKSGANKVSVNEINTGREMSILVRQLKYFNNLAKKDPRAAGADAFWTQVSTFHGPRSSPCNPEAVYDLPNQIRRQSKVNTGLIMRWPQQA